MIKPSTHKEKLSILLVEDDPSDARLVKEILNEARLKGFAPAVALTQVGQLAQALTLLDKTRFDVILVDLFLPDSQGLTTVRRLIQVGPQLPLIVMSGLADQRLAVAAVQAGAQDYLVKGYVDDHGLPRAISYAIERKEMAERLRQSEQHYKSLSAELQSRNQELQEALAKVKTLSGLLPICASCKDIRDDQGYWHQVEAYILSHAEVEFSHGICPDCLQKLYPEFYPKEPQCVPTC